MRSVARLARVEVEAAFEAKRLPFWRVVVCVAILSAVRAKKVRLRWLHGRHGGR